MICLSSSPSPRGCSQALETVAELALAIILAICCLRDLGRSISPTQRQKLLQNRETIVGSRCLFQQTLSPCLLIVKNYWFQISRSKNLPSPTLQRSFAFTRQLCSHFCFNVDKWIETRVKIYSDRAIRGINFVKYSDSSGSFE